MATLSEPVPVLLGTAGWSLPREQWPSFATEGTHLQRYASRLSAVEINTSFYRPHRPATYARWAQSVPATFRFCVKVPKQITHERRLVDCDRLLECFLRECGYLGERLGCLLIQLPPSLAYDSSTAEVFFAALRAGYSGSVAFEPRHPSWLDAEPLLQREQVARVAADPAPFPAAAEPGGWPGLRYYRLHGASRIYFSSYGADWLRQFAARLAELQQKGVTSWCIFDNTASGASMPNALDLQGLLANENTNRDA